VPFDATRIGGAHGAADLAVALINVIDAVLPGLGGSLSSGRKLLPSLTRSGFSPPYSSRDEIASRAWAELGLVGRLLQASLSS